jgi:hypothetical protein
LGTPADEVVADLAGRRGDSAEAQVDPIALETAFDS